MRNVLVTGGAGFIGHHLVKRLFETDCDVTVIDNLSKLLGKIKNAMRSQNVSRSHFIRLRHVANNRHNLNDGSGGGDHHYDNDVSLYIDDIGSTHKTTHNN